MEIEKAIGLMCLAVTLKPEVETYKEYVQLIKLVDRTDARLLTLYTKVLDLDDACEWAHLGVISEHIRLSKPELVDSSTGKSTPLIGLILYNEPFD